MSSHTPPAPHVNSFVLGPAVINTHATTPRNTMFPSVVARGRNPDLNAYGCLQNTRKQAVRVLEAPGIARRVSDSIGACVAFVARTVQLHDSSCNRQRVRGTVNARRIGDLARCVCLCQAEPIFFER
jgi:hypothetical protein